MRYPWPKAPTRWMDGTTLCISIPFTWDLPGVRRALLMAHGTGQWSRVLIGGPAVCLMPDYFADLDFVDIGQDAPGVLQRVNPMATRTTRGCPRGCGFCGVRTIEPGWSELADWPDLPVIMDNNLLASSEQHFDRVMDRLEGHGWADIQGFDSRLVNEHHAERLARLAKDKRTKFRVGLDSFGYQEPWSNAMEAMRKAGIPKRVFHIYSVVGFRETPEQAWRRCDWIERQGVTVAPQRYQSLDALQKNVLYSEQRENGWTQDEFSRLMGFYWRRRGTRPAWMEAA